MVSLLQSMGPDHPAEPVLVLSNVPDAGGLEKARACGVPTAVVEHRPFGSDRKAFEAALHAEMIKAAPDIICLAGFMRILTPDFINLWHGNMLNIHPSLLPKYKGLHTHQRALEAGETKAGCSVHEVTADLDGGPILGQGQVSVRSDDTPETLARRVLAMEHQLYPAVLRNFAAGKKDLLVL